ncbi:MAG: AI-2E family transporter [Actinomycetota bacterium]|nr:AI-2E family transporter [Actinomycetota bacterium]
MTTTADEPRPTASPPRGVWLTLPRLLQLVTILVAAYCILAIVRALRGVLVMLLVALFLSFAAEPAVQFLARRGVRRGLATGVVFVVGLLVATGMVVAMVPLFVQQVTDLIDSVPRSINDLNEILDGLPFIPSVEVTPELEVELRGLALEFGERARTVALGAAGNVVSLGATAFGALFQLLAVGLVTFYLVADGPRLRRTLARPLPPERQREMLAIWELAIAKTGGYIYSRLLLAFACGLAHLLLLLLLGVPFALPLALWVGVTSAFVPVVGTYLGGVLLVLVALVNNPINALWVVAFIVLYQQLENYALAPAIQSRTMDVHPAVAFVSVLIGGTLLGGVGALLALPATAIIQALLSTYVRRHSLIDELRDVALPSEPQQRPSRSGPRTKQMPA